MFNFPLKFRPIPWRKTPFFNMLYLSARGQGGPDPTIAWTSEIEWQPLQDFIQEFNQHHHRLISTSHVLAQAVGWAIGQHPHLNRRVVGRRVYQFKNCNISLTTRIPNDDEVKVIQIQDADKKTVGQFAYIVFKKQLGYIRGNSPECKDLNRLGRIPGWLFRWSVRTVDWLDRHLPLPTLGRIDRLRESVVLVNDYSHPRFPTMRSYKPSRLPNESKTISVTLGKAEAKVHWEGDRAVKKMVAPLVVRIDHRVADGVQLAEFISTIGSLLADPAQMQLESPSSNEPNQSTTPLPSIRKSAA